MRGLIDWIKLLRSPLLILGFMASFSLMYYVGKWGSLESILILLTIGFANTFFNLMNEIYDVDIDRINKPWKPLPSGRISVDSAYKVSMVFLLMFVCSFTTLVLLYGSQYFMIGIVGLCSAYIYNILQRRDIIGNVALALSYGTAAYMSSYPYLLLFASAFALHTCIHNIVLQIQDLEADRGAGLVTVPVQIGISWTRTLIVCLGILTIFLYICSDIQFYTRIFFILAVISCIVCAISNRWFEGMVRISGRVLMTLGFLSFIL